MDKRQKLVVWVALALIVWMGLYPPWVQSFQRGDGRWGPTAGSYGWIFDPPGPPPRVSEGYFRDWRFWTNRIDTPRLAIQWLMVSMVAAGLVWTLRRSER
jgi:hypothetical protein